MPPPPRPRSAMGHRSALDEVELSSDSDSEEETYLSQQPVYPAPRPEAATADETLQLGCWDGNVLAELDDFLGVLDEEEAAEATGEASAHSSRSPSVRESSKRKHGASSTIDEDAPFGFGATSAVDESVIPNVDESAISNVADESGMPTVEESAILSAPASSAPRMPCPPPAKRQKPAAGGQEASRAPPHRMRSHRRPHSQMSGSIVSSSRSGHYSTRGSSMYSSGRLSRASTFNGSAASVASNPFDEPSDPGFTRRDEDVRDDSPPDNLRCCLSKVLMTDPVVAADGYTYERAAILEWRETGNTISPMTQEEFGSSVLIENKQIKKQLSEYPSSTAAATLGGKANRADSPAQSSSVGAAPSALDCGILVPREKAATDAFAPGGGRGPVLSRPALAPPSKPRSNLQCASLPRGRRGSGTGNVRGGRGVPMQTHQEQHSNLDCAILVPSDAMAHAIPEAPLGFAGMRGGSSVLLAAMPKSSINAGPPAQPLPILKSKMPSALAPLSERPGSGGVISEVRRAAALDAQLGVGVDFA